MTMQADSPAVTTVIASEALTTFYDGMYTEFFVASIDPHSRELTTTEFYEKRPDLGDIQILKRVNWDVAVPPGGQLFVATSGLLRNNVNAFWVGWRTSDTLSALSVFQESPINAPLDPQMKLIRPAILVPSGKMLHYFWLPKDGAWSLYTYRFQSDQGKRGSVSRERLRQTNREPLLSAAVPIPGAEDDRTAVAWIEQADTGIRLTAMLSAGDSSEILVTPAIPLITAVPRQRLAMHVGKSGIISVGFVAESRTRGYVAMEVRFDFPKHIFTFHPSSLRIPFDSVSSACMIYSKNQHERSCHVYAVTETGVLSVTKPGSDLVRVLREQVDPSYDYPVLTSATGMYEVVQSGGQIEMSLFP
jgi:hypothetical protein